MPPSRTFTRDYFHGRGKDFYDDKQARQPPLESPHVAAVHESSNQAALAVVFSVPIRTNETAPPLGVLGMSINLGNFASLEVELPPGQQVLLVDTRSYYMQRAYPKPHEERGAGLVLHHEALRDPRNRIVLPHIDDTTVQYMLQYKKRATKDETDPSPNNLIPDGFHDPLSEESESRCLAAFAPVIVKTRPGGHCDTGWFLIVQQAQHDD